MEADEGIDYLEQLEILKQIGHQQRGVLRLQDHIERCYHGYSECLQLKETCSTETRDLESERERLVARIHDIDTDIQKLSELTSQLDKEATLRCLALPPDDYSLQLSELNQRRESLGLSPLPECQAYRQLKHCLEESGVLQSTSCASKLHSKRSRTAKRLHHVIVGKAGKSFKYCPYCMASVSRNCILCPNCNTQCSRAKRT